MTYRILVTGSRTWTNKALIWRELSGVLAELKIPHGVPILVHGGAGGADAFAATWAYGYGVLREAFLAQWAIDGKQAGIIRNVRMINAGADICLAFIKDGSAGASHCARLAEAADIPTMRFHA